MYQLATRRKENEKERAEEMAVAQAKDVLKTASKKKRKKAKAAEKDAATLRWKKTLHEQEVNVGLKVRKDPNPDKVIHWRHAVDAGGHGHVGTCVYNSTVCGSKFLGLEEENAYRVHEEYAADVLTAVHVSNCLL
jgi:hypothetical protein